MNFRLWLCVAMGVLVIHIGVFVLWANFFQPRPKPHPRSQNEFRAAAQAIVDPNTGEHLVVREFTVSTKLATPAPSGELHKDEFRMTKEPGPAR